jgi:hypothetical protein
MLDMVAALLSTGNAVFQIPTEVPKETKLSQVFIALSPPKDDRETHVRWHTGVSKNCINRRVGCALPWRANTRDANAEY